MQMFNDLAVILFIQIGVTICVYTSDGQIEQHAHRWGIVGRVKVSPVVFKQPENRARIGGKEQVIAFVGLQFFFRLREQRTAKHGFRDHRAMTKQIIKRGRNVGQGGNSALS